MKIVGSIVALITLIGLCFGVLFFADNRYAASSEVKKISIRLDYKIVSDQLQAIQERIWKIEDRYKGKPVDATAAEELRQLYELKAKIQAQLKIMETK